MFDIILFIRLGRLQVTLQSFQEMLAKSFEIDDRVSELSSAEVFNNNSKLHSNTDWAKKGIDKKL